jgi:hypothetical protein
MSLRSMIGVVVLTSGLIAGGVALAGVSPAHALGNGRYNICHDNGNGTQSCLNNTAGYASSNNPIQYWAYGTQGEPNNDWNIGAEGTVVGTNCSSCWPFVTGSGLNAKYNGDPVYEFVWSQNTDYCADALDYYTPSQYGNLLLEECGPSSSQWYVYSSSHFLVAVNASNSQYNKYHVYQQPVWLGADNDNTNNGQPVWISPSVDNSETYGFNVAHVH